MSGGYINEVFGPDGLFAGAFPGYETRPGQIAISVMIDEAMRHGKNAVVEGPCGTGKGVAYCVPAIWHAITRNKRVVIATANIALQEQLVQKDLPMLQSLLPWRKEGDRKFSFALLKGRSNYLCLDRKSDTEGQDELRLVPEQQDQADQIMLWAAKTKTGDVSELPFVPDKSVWSRFSVSSDDCKGGACPFNGPPDFNCLVERARVIAFQADIVVTNYHLLFAHLAIRAETGMDLVLPGFELCVLDEAHEAADVARDFFGFRVSEYSIGKLAKWLESETEGQGLAARLRKEGRAFFDAVTRTAKSPEYRKRLRNPGVANAARLETWLSEADELARIISQDEPGAPLLPEERRPLVAKGGQAPADKEKVRRASAQNARRRAVKIRLAIKEACGLLDENKVYFIELGARDTAWLCGKPIDVSRLLAQTLFECAPGGHEAHREAVTIESVSMTSATLTTSGNFDFIRREAGVPAGALELEAESPFDFPRQALLVIPDDIPDPRQPEFTGALAAAACQVIEACNGRTLCLFTSYKNLNAVYDQVARNNRGGHTLLRQGDLPRSELSRIFKTDVSSVLFGTESFWTGIDVQGPALTGLVIDKLPFPNMDDPLVDAICSNNPNAFDEYLVPKAIILLRQGVGRLIRSQKDFGVVVILDKRLVEARYGRRFLLSLPPMRWTRDLEHAALFLAKRAPIVVDAAESGSTELIPAAQSGIV